MAPMIAPQTGKTDGLTGETPPETGDRLAVSGSFDGRTHVYPLRVYYEDTDAAGIVYHANYLKFAERARTEMMRLLGSDHRSMLETDGVGFAVRTCVAEYLRPARLEDFLEVHSTVDSVGGASVEMGQTVMQPDVSNGLPTTLVRMRIRLACIDASQRAARLPARVREALRRLVEA